MQTTQTLNADRNLILCVEDERDLRDNIVEELCCCGHEAIGVGNGREALDALEHVRPDLILCDIYMPGMDGYGLLEAIRSERADLGDVPFIFLTALSEREDVICGKRAGADDYLVKPIDFDLMHASIETRLEQVRRARALHRQESGALREAFDGLAGSAPTPDGISRDVLDILGFGVVLADGNGDVVFANAFAHSLSAETCGFHPQGRLRAQTPELTRKLQARMAEVADAAVRGDDVMQGLALPLVDGSGELLLVICALPRDEHGNAESPLVTIFVTHAQRRPAPPEHVLASLFGLTPAESQLARNLVCGQRSAHIARSLNVSQTTIAFHMRNLFEKTGTHRQVDLVALILNTLAAVR